MGAVNAWNHWEYKGSQTASTVWNEFYKLTLLLPFLLIRSVLSIIQSLRDECHYKLWSEIVANSIEQQLDHFIFPFHLLKKISHWTEFEIDLLGTSFLYTCHIHNEWDMNQLVTHTSRELLLSADPHICHTHDQCVTLTNVQGGRSPQSVAPTWWRQCCSCQRHQL